MTPRLRATARLADDVAPTLDALARATAGGLTLQRALEELGAAAHRPFASLLYERVARHHRGAPLADALASATAEATCPEVSFAFTTLQLLARFGGSAPTALDRAASAVRERRSAIAERRVQAAQARLSSLVLSILPVAFGFWSLRSDHRVAHFVLHTSPGALCVGAGLVLNTLGWFWMSHIIGGTS